MKSRQIKRDQAIDETSRTLRGILRPLALRGFYGSVPLELKLQDGVVTVVESIGIKETHAIRLPAAAA